MNLRVLAFLLTVLVAVGVAAPTVAAAPDVAGLVDDGADGAAAMEPALVVGPDALALPGRDELRQIVAPITQSPGRLHRVAVFRPPRQSASR